MREFSTLIDLLEGLQDADRAKGVRFVSARFHEDYYSWAELHRRMLFHAEHLINQGVEAGQKVVIPLHTDIDIVASFLALIWIGAVPISISGQMTGQERGAYLARIGDLIDRHHFDRIVLDNGLARSVIDGLTLDPKLLANPHPPTLDPDREPPSIAPARVGEDDVAFIQFSSGSTSRPKGVQITHRNICANLRLIVENDARTANSCVVAWLPLYHDMGLVGGLLSPMIFHNTLVLMNPVCFLMKPVSWLDYISRYRGTVAPVPNFAIDMCVTRIRDSQLEARKPDLSSMEYIYNGSEPINADSVEKFYERFAPYGLRRGIVHPAYGMAEATLMITTPKRGGDLIVKEMDGVRVVSVGRPRGDFRIKIAGEDGSEPAPMKVGEVMFTGSCLTPGYYQNEEENRRRFVDGWFRTGDLGFVDEEGNLFITGRIKDLIIVNGKNYYAHDIVAKLEELPFVKRGKTHVFSLQLEGKEVVIVMTVPVSRMSSTVRGKLEILKKFLSKEQGSWVFSQLGAKAGSFISKMDPEDVDALKEELKAFLLREFGLPIHEVFVVPGIPRTTSGKIRRGECEALYRQHLKTSGGQV